MESRFYSTQEAVSDGTLTQLIVTVFFPPGARDSIHVFFDGVEDDDRWSWSAPNVNTILFREPVPAGQTVLVRRLTQMDEVPHIFGNTGGATGNSQFSYVTVDENFDFFKRATQDSMDSFMLTGASAEQAQFWALQAEAFSNSAEGYRNGAASSAASATTSANLSGQSASASASSASASAASQTQAAAARDKAQKWAQEAEDVPVEPGLYSAFHWAQKAKDFAGGDAYLQKDRSLSDIPNVQAARNNLGLKNAAIANIVGTMAAGDIIERE